MFIFHCSSERVVPLRVVLSLRVVSFGVLIALFSLCTFSYPLRFIMPTEQPPSDATDIFSLSDRVLADKLQFEKEVRFSNRTTRRLRRLMYPFKIGFGNWGSVWLCRPRVSKDAGNSKLAVKLVHRSKTTTTTAARVRSL